MIFFAGNDGSIISSFPSPVYQGGANANTVYLVAPFASNAEVTVAFKLPNGVYTARTPMTKTGEIEGAINKRTGKPYSGWQYSLPNEITAYYGTVTAQFYFYGAQTGKILASSSTSFVVGRGVPEIPPTEPTEDVYDIILSNITALREQLENGTYAARAIYAYNSEYVYGAGELVFYPERGEYGTFLKSLVTDNNNPPYVNGGLNSEYWSEVVDFNVLNDLYALKEDAEASAGKAAESAAEAAGSAKQAGASATAAQASEEAAQGYSENAESKANEAKDWADVAKHYAQFGLKLNTDYNSVDELPVPGNAQNIYLIPNGASGNNSYDEYVWIESKNAYEKIGTTEIDLTDYATKAEVASTYATIESVSAAEADIEQLKKGKANINGVYPALTAGYARALSPGVNVDGILLSGSFVVHLGQSTTDSSVTEKLVYSLGGGVSELRVGLYLRIRFTKANTVSSPTLKLDGLEAKPIRCLGRTTGLLWRAGEIITFLYWDDGAEETHWEIVSGYSLADKPVGSLYFSAAATSPANLFGGSWEKITDKFLIGAGGSYSLGATGGSKDAVVVSHSHGQREAINGVIAAAAVTLDGVATEYGYKVNYSGFDEGATSNILRSFTEGESGTDKNMPPYLAVNIWKRTA